MCFYIDVNSATDHQTIYKLKRIQNVLDFQSLAANMQMKFLQLSSLLETQSLEYQSKSGEPRAGPAFANKHTVKRNKDNYSNDIKLCCFGSVSDRDVRKSA